MSPGRPDDEAEAGADSGEPAEAEGPGPDDEADFGTGADGRPDGDDEGRPDTTAPDAVDEERFVDGTTGRSDLAAERDEFLEDLQRVKADFDNYRKRTEKQRLEAEERANERLARALLPVFDACDAALDHGVDEVKPIVDALVESLGREGLERMEPEGDPFDPNLHEAVMHEEGEGESTVVDVLRSGYTWKGRVLRPAMVKVKG